MATKKPMLVIAIGKAPAGKKAAPFKPCKGCPNPAKCAKMGACMMKSKAK
jgi:hypothetical protein